MNRSGNNRKMMLRIAKKEGYGPGMSRLARVARIDEDVDMVRRASLGDVVITVVVMCVVMLGLLYVL